MSGTTTRDDPLLGRLLDQQDDPLLDRLLRQQVQQAQQRQPGVLDRLFGGAARLNELAGRGFSESVAATLGTPMDLYNRGLAAVGLPAMPPDFYREAIRRLLPHTDAAPAQSGVERLAEGAGRGAADAVSVLAPAAAASRLPGLAGRVAGALAERPGMQMASAALGGAVSDATGSPLAGTAAALAVPAASMAARRMLGPVPNRLSAEERRLLAVLDEEGVPTTIGQRTGSPGLRLVESQMARIPSTAGAEAERITRQQEAFTQAAMRRMGPRAAQAGPRLTPEAVERVGHELGSDFAAIAARNRLNVNPLDPIGRQNIADLARATGTAQRYGTADTARNIMNRAEDLLRHVENGGIVPGRAVAELDSDLSRAIRTTTDGMLKQHLREFRHALREAFGRSISVSDKGDWAEFRRRYANFAVLRDAMSQQNPQTAQGLLTPSALGNALARSVGRPGFAAGQGDLNDLARAGRIFVQDNIPDSATSQRALVTALLSGTGVGAATGDPLAAALAGAATHFGPQAFRRLYYSRMAQQLMREGLGQQALRVDPEVLAGVLAARLRGEGTQALVPAAP